MKPGRIRPIAICIFENNGKILVAEGRDYAKGDYFYRPLGGSIEYGEHSTATIERELREEIGADVTGLRYLGTLENIFTYNGQPGHEIVIVYSGDFAGRSIYEQHELTGYEDDGTPFKVVWKSPGEFGEDARLVPEGLTEFLRDASEHRKGGLNGPGD